MTQFPQPHPKQRSARLEFPVMAPVVIRFEDGRYRPGKLRAISLTGGLLRLPRPHVAGALVEVIFMSANGPLLGVAELLSPVSATLKCLQPFKFIMIDDDDYQRLTNLIGASLGPMPIDDNRQPSRL